MTASRPLPRTLCLGLGLLALAVGGAALSWACTPNANVAVAGPGGSGLVYPGGRMTVAANSFANGANVTVHWGGAGGPVIARGTGPSFTVNTTAPNVADGTYYVVAKGLDSDGTTERTGSAPVVVGEPGVDRRPAAGGNSGSSGSAPAGGNTAKVPAPGSTSGSTSGATNSTRGSGSRAVSGAERGTVRARDGAAGDAGSRATGTAGVTTLPSGQSVFADSVGANTPKAAGAANRASAPRSTAASATKRTATSDLWSGFSADKSPAASLGGSVGPQSGPGSGLTLSLALAGLGLLALLGGGAAAEARRRRMARAGSAPRG